MNSIERVQTVLRGGIPDRVPVDLHNFMMTAQAFGMPFPEFFKNGEAMAEAQIRAWKEFGHDVLLLENGTAALALACGCGVEYFDESAPVSFTPAIASLDEETGATLEVHASGGTVERIAVLVDGAELMAFAPKEES